MNSLTSNMQTIEFYAYSWHIDEEQQDETFIRVYGFDDQNNNVCVSINGFQCFVWIELPTHINWKEPEKMEMLNHYFQLFFPNVKISLKFRRKLYGANLRQTKGRYAHKLFPFLLCSCQSFKTLKFDLVNKFKNKQNIYGLGLLKFNVHGQDACPRLQLTSKYDLPTAGWIKFNGKEILQDKYKFTYCTREFLVNLNDKTFKPYDIICRSDKTLIPKPLILSFDLEVNSEDQVTMPKASRPGDVVFQISCVFSVLGSNTHEKYLLSLGNPLEKIVSANIKAYTTEQKLLMGFRDLVNEKNPNVIIGYNIFNFDIPYLMDRANHKAIYIDWSQQGFPKNKPGIQREIKWSSSAYKNQQFRYLDCEGRLYIDLLPVVQRDFKLNDYKLKTVSAHFIGETKDDLDPTSIFRCYNEGIKNNGERSSKYMSICGKYCIQDSMLVIKLFEKLNVWYGLSEMATVCNVPMIVLFTKGQQIKVYSNLYKYCLENKIVPEKDGYVVSENERYVGAYVFDPKPGLYENVVPLDFCIAGDTLISRPNGTSIKIQDITNNQQVYGCKEDKIIQSSVVGNLQKKGFKETIKVVLQDGREIITTPDHKFMLENGDWCEAQNLLNNRILCGIEQPEDIHYKEEEPWILNTSEFNFNFKTLFERSRTLAFCRVLGYVLADGSIYINKTRVMSEAYFGTMLDANLFMDDLKLILTDLKYTSFGCRQRITPKGTCIHVSIPSVVSRMFESIPGVMIGKRSAQATKLPEFLMKKNCPLSILREFIGGLFGGDGTAPHMSKSKLFTISFKWDTIFTWKDDLVKTFHDLSKLLSLFDIQTTVQDSKYVNAVNFKPKDEAKNLRVNCILAFNISDICKFQDKIGFRYCINKSNRLYAASSYQKFQNKVRKHYNFALDSVNELMEKMTIKEKLGKTGSISPFDPCFQQVYKQLDKMPILDPIPYISKKELLYQRGEQKRHADRPRKLSLHAKKFISFSDYIDQIGASEWFATSVKEKKYSVKSLDTVSPTLKFMVKYIIPHTKIEVYDIEVAQVHNFVGNGAILHNCSLYPSIIISYNLDYTTCAFDPSIPDELCHVMEWEDHIACKHDPKVIRKVELTKTIDKLTENKKQTKDDKTLISQYRKERSDITKSLNKNVMCEKRKYRFLKTSEEYPEFTGVLPTIVQSLLDARKETRKQMGELKTKLKSITDEHERKDLETTISILNQRQLAYKVSANSMYGITGVKAGMLPFMPIAMSITYKGRENILKAAEYGKKNYGGELVYGDTDSNYFSFPKIKDHKELWDFAIKVAAEISSLFPSPMKLEFEEAIYTKFLILTKKRYMYKTALRDGTVKPEIGKRGVLLNRRDNSAFIRNTYENMIKIIFDNTEPINVLQDKVITTLIDNINSMFNHELPVEDFIITKSTGDYGNLQPQYFQNEKGLHRSNLGQYNVPFLTDEIREQEGINTPQEETNWYLDKLPAHIQLLEKIRRRGQICNEGSRMEFVILETDDLKDKQSAKIESLNYYKKNKDVLHLDYLYYMSRLINPIDQILDVLFGLKDFTKIHHNDRTTKRKLTIQLNDLFAPNFEIEKDRLYLIRINDKYQIIYGSKRECKQRIKDLKNMDKLTEIILKLDYTPTENLYQQLKQKYGNTSTLKTKFIFKDDDILLGDMSESKLISVIKKEFK